MNEDLNKEVITEEQVTEAAEAIEEAAETAEPASAPQPEKKQSNIVKEIREWIIDIAAAIIIAVLILQFLMPTIVKEHSMENTLQNNDYIFVSKKAYTLFGQPDYGDIIVFQSELENSDGKNKLLIKRIIGLPGDTIEIHGGVVFRNGNPLIEGYTKDGYTGTELDLVTVEEGKLFCMGDNRQNSADSRDSRIGQVDMSTVKGKAIFRIFPFSKIGGLK